MTTLTGSRRPTPDGPATRGAAKRSTAARANRTGHRPGDAARLDLHRPRAPIIARLAHGGSASGASAETLLRHRATLPVAHPDRERIRNRIIEDHLPLAHRLARRYAGRGEAYDDLAQAAALALIKAVDGYQPDREVPLAGYAVPTIVGSLKRHFRDTGWAMRVPRSAQELTRKVGDATDVLSQHLGHMPTPAELAAYLDVSVSAVVAATGARQAYRLSSLDTFPAGDDQDGSDLASLLGGTDPCYEQIDNSLSLKPLLAALPLRMRRILAMRFDDELSQTQIATEVGLSQMQVSRLLKAVLHHLRTALSAR